MENDLNDDWGNFLKQKEATNKLLDQQLVRKSIEDKKNYKQELDLQTSLKDQERHLQQEQKRKELMLVDLKGQHIQSEESKKRQEKFEFQKFMAKQYEFQSNYIKNKQKLDYLSKIEEDKKKINQIESQIIKDSQSKKEQKLQLMKQEQEILKARNLQKIQETQNQRKEKSKDLELLNLRAQQDQNRDKQQKDFYKKRESHQEALQNLYLSTVSPQLSEKSNKIDMWLHKSIEEKAQALRAKESYENQIKQETMKNMKLIWNYQIQEKNERLRKLKEEQVNIFNSIQNQVSESRRAEQLREIEKKNQQSNYKDFLMSQPGNGRRNSSSSFVENSAGSFHGRSSSIAPRAVYPTSPKESQSSGGSFVSYHNPITNPIGDSPPRPINRPLFKPHTLIPF